MNLRVRRVTGVSLSAMLSTSKYQAGGAEISKFDG